MPSAKEKRAAEAAQKVQEEGLFVALESDKNAIDVSNDSYLGVDPEYRNHADVTLEPFDGEDDEIVQRQREFEESVTNVGFQGFDPVVETPSEEGSDEDAPEEEQADQTEEGSNQSPV